MSDKDPGQPSRRAFLKGAAGGAGAAVLGATAARAEGDPLITEVQPWAQGLGDGMDAVRYGMPIKFEDDVPRHLIRKRGGVSRL